MDWLKIALGVVFTLLPAIAMAAISIAYFIHDKSGSSLPRRVLTSAHGAIGAVLYAICIGIVAIGEPQPEMAMVLLLLYAVPLALVIVSFVAYRGPKAAHFLQILNLPVMIVGGVIGSMWAGIIRC